MVNRLDPLKASLIVAQAHGRFRGVRLTGPAWFADHVERIVENAPGVNYFNSPLESMACARKITTIEKKLTSCVRQLNHDR